MTILPQFSLFPKGRNEGGAPAHAAEGCGSLETEFPTVLGTEVSQLMLFQVTPNVFTGVEFWGISRKRFDHEPTLEGVNELTHHTASMDCRAVPNQKNFTRDVPEEMGEKLNDLRAFDRTVKELEIEVEDGNPRHDREALPVEMELENGSLAPRRPSADPVRFLAQAALVDEDNDPSLAESFFLISGQRFCFQFRTDFSSRSRARPTGRWQLHPNLWRSR